eukprot:TRINITY_DN2610_c1_g1_i2.p1 TRINITY_DN2610_c1_g1~~TRINITY_DN2610_c1_g1_i2.p1  ORF type:complete len:163 (+),score=18.80 TRINITY_DN2610_c1_g1_i2:747-1235(+)
MVETFVDSCIEDSLPRCEQPEQEPEQQPSPKPPITDHISVKPIVNALIQEGIAEYNHLVSASRILQKVFTAFVVRRSLYFQHISTQLFNLETATRSDIKREYVYQRDVISVRRHVASRHSTRKLVRLKEALCFANMQIQMSDSCLKTKIGLMASAQSPIPVS